MFPYVFQHNQEPADDSPDKGTDPAGKEEERRNKSVFSAGSVLLSHLPCKCTVADSGASEDAAVCAWH